MKTLMTILATIAITSAASAQRSNTGTCTITSDECGTSTRSYNVRVRATRTSNGTNITDRETGELIDTFNCEAKHRVRCVNVGRVFPASAALGLPSPRPTGIAPGTRNVAADKNGAAVSQEPRATSTRTRRARD